MLGPEAERDRVGPSPRFVLGVAAAIVALAFGLATGAFGAQSGLVSQLAMVVAAALAAVAAARRGRLERRFFAMSLACALWCAGQVAFVWGLHSEGDTALELLEIALFGAAGVVAVVAIVRLLPASRTQRVALALDAIGAAAALVGVLWVPLYQPSLDVNPLATVFPTVDIALAVACISLVCTAPRGDRAVTGVAAGLVVLAIADLVYVYEEGSGGYRPGALLDVLWVVAFATIGVAAHVYGHVFISRRWLPLVPTAPLGVLLPVAFGVQIVDGSLPPALVFGGVIGGATFFVRQVLLHWEHERLTEVVRHERDLARVAEERARLVVEYSSDGLVATDANGQCIFINSAGASLLGVQAADIIGRRMHEIVHSTHRDGSPFPAEECELGAAVRAGRTVEVDLDWWTCADGSMLPVSVAVHPCTTSDHTATAAVVTFRDIRTQVEAHEALRHEAAHDALTGLVNRRAIGRVIEDRLTADGRVGLLLLDLNDFKDVNDALGHSTGDLLIAEVARRLRKTTRGDDVVARLGGDEFGVVVGGVASAHDLRAAGKRIADALTEPFDVGGWSLRVTASAGGAWIDGQLGQPDALLQRADIAMYRAKRSGLPLAIYGVEDEDDRLARLTLSADLPDAIAGGAIVAHYQPKLDLVTGRLAGVEALARWQHPTLGHVAPDVFFDIAAHSGLIAELTCHVLHGALGQAVAWRDAGFDVPVAVNLAPALLTDPALADKVLQAVVAAGLEPSQLTLEITEEGIADADERALDTLRRLRSTGIRVSIDDFGTGYSSLGYLKSLPVDELKIDRSFVADLARDPTDERIVRTIIELADAVGLTTVAEGVEDDASLAILRAAGCDQAQGFGLHRPLPGDQVTELLLTCALAALRPDGAVAATA